MSYYSNPTANAAIGSIDREIRKMEKRAKRLKERKDCGRLSPQQEAAAYREFSGIFRPILERALNPKAETSPADAGDVCFYFFTYPPSNTISSDTFIETAAFSVVKFIR